jgi:hypothetical protein
MDFLNLVHEYATSKGVKWDDIVLKFEQIFENRAIIEYLDQQKVLS